MPRRERTTTKEAAAQGESFEAQLASLERIVRELERGELPLERSLELFERGVRLSRECQERLNEAERRIEVLLASGEGGTAAVVAPFGSDELDAEAAAADEEDDESVF